VIDTETARRRDVTRRFIVEARQLPGVPHTPAHRTRLSQLARRYRHELDPANPGEACEALLLEFNRRHPF
jgi:hypothetical protein